MTREEAIERIKARFDKWALDNDDLTALQALDIVDTDSEDEKIRKVLLNLVSNDKVNGYTGFYEESGITCDDAIAYLEKQKEQIPYIDFVIKPHKGDDTNPYDMSVSEAQEYAINRGFGIPFNDGEVYVDERHMTQTIGNILRWADEHPKEQKPAEYLPKEKVYNIMTKLTELSSSQLIPINSPEYLKIHDITRDVRSLLDYPIEQKPVDSEEKFESIDNAFRRGRETGFREGVESVKPAEWSEEDEEMRDRILEILNKYGNIPVSGGKVQLRFNKEYMWLKSLRPSKDCSSCAKHLEGYISGRCDAENKLLEQFGAIITPEDELHIKPRWKPSGEQMQYLLAVINDPNNAGAESCHLILE